MQPLIAVSMRLAKLGVAVCPERITPHYTMSNHPTPEELKAAARKRAPERPQKEAATPTVAALRTEWPTPEAP